MMQIIGGIIIGIAVTVIAISYAVVRGWIR